ncbi:MAG TPA: hypothetical protein VM493_01250 [Vicinamibacterales bacterium]|nr:hypothetical protein [Vicinamibacterales bacterium]
MHFVKCTFEQGAFSSERLYTIQSVKGAVSYIADESQLRLENMLPVGGSGLPWNGNRLDGWLECRILKRDADTRRALIDAPGMVITVGEDLLKEVTPRDPKLEAAIAALSYALVGAKVDYDRSPYQLGDDGDDRLKRDEHNWRILDAQAVKDIADGGLDPFLDLAGLVDYWRQSAREWEKKAAELEVRAYETRPGMVNPKHPGVTWAAFSNSVLEKLYTARDAIEQLKAEKLADLADYNRKIADAERQIDNERARLRECRAELAAERGDA